MAEEDGVYFVDDITGEPETLDLKTVVSGSHVEKEEPSDCSLDKLAVKLLKGNFILTALEFHTELVESGRELPRLRDYFSNPGNFEKHSQISSESPPVLPRTSSVQTFDSLDFARYSDDGERQIDERVAVLEFELRKAKETIKALRANLTVATESDPNTPTSGTARIVGPETVKPHEKRALNFLVNEYLLQHNYKLTSITFSDENDDQDFEDWDDVGLNIPKPPDLLHLYRNYCRHIHQSSNICDQEVQTDVSENTVESQHSEFKSDSVEETVETLPQEELLTPPQESEVLRLIQEKEELCQMVKALKRELKSLKTTVPPMKDESIPLNVHNKPDELPVCDSDIHSDVQEYVIINPFSSDINQESNVDSESFTSCHNADAEVGDVTSYTSTFSKMSSSQDSNLLSLHSARKVPQEFQKLLTSLCQSQKIYHGSRLVNEVTEVMNSNEKVVMMLARCLPHIVPNVLLAKRDIFRAQLFRASFKYMIPWWNHILEGKPEKLISEDLNHILEGKPEKLSSEDLSSEEGHTVQTVDLNKEELIPLILCTITLHPDAKQRDKLLNILFNLIKKPDEEQRQMILTGLAAISQHLGPSRVEAELLPQCWEQITHRYCERRLLVAESCGVLAPYVPSVIRSSLLLSMLQQMLQEDKDESVREAVVKNLALLLLHVDDGDKFSQATHLLLLSLRDRSSNVNEAALNILLPSIAVWALELDRLESHLLPSMMKALEDLYKHICEKPVSPCPSQEEEQQPVLLIRAVNILLHFLFLSVIESGPYVDDLEQITVTNVSFQVDRLPAFQNPVCNPATVINDANKLASLVQAFDMYISAEWFKPWEKYEWFTKSLVPWFLQIVGLLNPERQVIVHHVAETVRNLCHLFGRTVTHTNVKAAFSELLEVSEEDISAGLNKPSFADATVPVYVSGVLTAFHQEEDAQELLQFLEELLCTLSYCCAPMKSMKSAIIELSTNKTYHELVLSLLWDGVVHTSPLVRISAGRLFEVVVGVVSESLLRTRVTPALVTLASDPDISVRVATVPAFGAIMEISSQKDLLEKVHLQLQTFLDDPLYWDQYLLHVEVIRTFAKVGPNAEPKFRDEFVLPRLAALAAQNNSVTDETRKTEVALALLDAYIAMSCCFMSDDLISGAFLPGLRCLKQDLQIVAPDHEESVDTIIHEFEAKVDLNRSIESRPSSLPIPSPGSMEEMKNRMSKIFANRPKWSKNRHS